MKATVKATEQEVLVEMNNYGIIYDRENETVMLTVENTPYPIFTKLVKAVRRELNSSSFGLENYE